MLFSHSLEKPTPGDPPAFPDLVGLNPWSASLPDLLGPMGAQRWADHMVVPKAAGFFTVGRRDPSVSAPPTLNVTFLLWHLVAVITSPAHSGLPNLTIALKLCLELPGLCSRIFWNCESHGSIPC